jgi:hypothetical protein
MNTTVDTTPQLQIASAAVDCSPLTEFFNTNAAANQDQIFFGVTANGAGGSCTTTTIGCVMAVNITGTPTTLSIASSIAEIGGPSGIIVDNNANTTPFKQTSSLYFSSQGNSTAALPCGGTGGPTGVGCAIKVTQSGLQ